MLPDLGGTWTGRYEVTRCRCCKQGCGDRVGTTGTIHLVLEQTDDAVVGTLSLEGMPSGNVRGTIALDGTLTLDGVWDPDDRLGPFAWRHYRLMDWKSTVTADTMSGFLHFVWLDAYEVEGRILSLTSVH